MGPLVLGGMGLAPVGAFLITGLDMGRSTGALMGDVLAMTGGVLAGA